MKLKIIITYIFKLMKFLNSVSSKLLNINKPLISNILNLKLKQMSYIFILLTLFYSIQITVADIPTHCKKSQVKGIWRITRTVTTEKEKNSIKDSVLCGHENPSKVKSSMQAVNLSKTNLKIKDIIYITLNEDNSAVIQNNQEQGRWTMVYDEGFDVTINKTSFKNAISYFFFLKFALNQNKEDKDTEGNRITSEHSSYCYVTLNGWYREGDQVGCVQGYKVSGIEKDDINDIPTNGEADNKQNVTEVGALKHDESSFVETEESILLDNTERTIVLNKELNIHKLIEKEDIFSLNKNKVVEKENEKLSFNSNKYRETNFLEVSSNIENKEVKKEEKVENNSDININNNKNIQLTNLTPFNFNNYKFTEVSTDNKITLHSGFKDHTKFAERINSADLSWKAHAYKEFEGKTISELNEFLKKKKTTPIFGNSNSTHNLPLEETKNEINENGDKIRFVQKNNYNYNDNFNLKSHNSIRKKLRLKSKSHAKTNTEVTKFLNVLEKIRKSVNSIDYSDIMNSPRSQGDCGSCFADSTISVLEARIKIKEQNLNFKISLDHILECSAYNQSCDGGYSYLVGKFGHENALLSSNCYEKGGSCNIKEECLDKKDSKVYIKDYYYVGGAYGDTTEKSIIKDLRENGPLVISFEPDYGFMNYREGIYRDALSSGKGRTNDNFKKENSHKLRLTNKNIKKEWEKVDHSVVLVGYGEENGIPYWKCMNSWGTNWGEKGFFRIIRGENHLSIESLAEGSIPVFEKSKTSSKQ